MTPIVNNVRLPGEYREWLKEKLSLAGTPYLFGSRTDLNAKGGDIDILLLSHKKLSFRELSDMRIAFIKQFGDQKLDIVNFTYHQENPFKELIMLDAKPL